MTAAAMQATTNTRMWDFLRSLARVLCLRVYVFVKKIGCRIKPGNDICNSSSSGGLGCGGHAVRLGRIFGRVDVEERIDRRRRPAGKGNAVRLREHLHLAQA